MALNRRALAGLGHLLRLPGPRGLGRVPAPDVGRAIPTSHGVAPIADRGAGRTQKPNPGSCGTHAVANLLRVIAGSFPPAGAVAGHQLADVSHSSTGSQTPAPQTVTRPDSWRADAWEAEHTVELWRRWPTLQPSRLPSPDEGPLGRERLATSFEKVTGSLCCRFSRTSTTN